MTDVGPVDLDARLDELFATEPKRFTAVRDALARELKAAGQADAAAAVKQLRRPTVAVAAINRVAHEAPDRLQDLVDVGDDLVALQAERTPDRDELRDLTRRRRAVLQELTVLAAGTTERPESARTSITATLEAASLDPALRDDLLRGRLTEALSPAARFVTDTTPGDASAPFRRTSTRRRRAEPPPRDELAARRARAELDAARERAAEADESAREHGELAAVAAARLDAAHRHIADLEAALADARAELVEAKRVEREAQRADHRARTEQERVTAALHAAERAVEAADS
jgi:hypothetical protein